ncbi:hypothetical protein D3C71_2031310 [compost metagenome]
MPDVFGDRGGIEHVAEVDGEDRKHHQPGLDMVAEQLDADHLAGAGINRRAHEHGIGDGKTIVDRKRTEQRAKG